MVGVLIADIFLAVYVVIALSFWNFPDGSGNTLNLVCS